MSIAQSLGRGIANTAAYTVHGACIAVSATGKFGTDLAEATSTQYTIKSAELAARRAAIANSAPPLPIVQRKARMAKA